MFLLEWEQRNYTARVMNFTILFVGVLLYCSGFSNASGESFS